MYGGNEVIKADELRELDTTQIAIPFGNGTRIPMQKHRDLLKLWNAMTDGNIIYVILNDYKLNLIAPASIEDVDFDKFHTEFGLAMKVLKYQNDDADRIIEETDHKMIGSNTAVFLNRVANLGLEFEEEGGKVDMCAAMEKRSQKDKVSGAIEILRATGSSENDIVNKIIENFGVTKEYVLALLAPKTA